MATILIAGGGTSATNCNASTWIQWNDSYISANGMTSVTSATSATVTNSTIWTYWVQGTSGASGGGAYNGASGTVTFASRGVAAAVSPEVAAERVRREAEYNQRRLEAETERIAARERAALLLQEGLSEKQRLELADKGHFSLKVIDSKTHEQRIYRIRRGRSGNVDRLDESGKVLNRFCIHPIIACPDEDTMLAQKFLLENDEETFLRTANRS